MEQQKTKEEWVIVLDFLPNGYPFDTRPSHLKTPIVQAIGKEHFTLLELVPKKGIAVAPNEELYIGEAKRDKIHHIIGKLPMTKLTGTAKSELDYFIQGSVHKNEARFVDFFNNAKPLTTRMHQLELLPGLGKKHMWEILEQREQSPFKSFEDITKRVKLMPNPEKAVIKRIIMELEGNEKHYVFVEH